MRILYLWMSIFSAVSFAADNQRIDFMQALSTVREAVELKPLTKNQLADCGLALEVLALFVEMKQFDAESEQVCRDIDTMIKESLGDFVLGSSSLNSKKNIENYLNNLFVQLAEADNHSDGENQVSSPSSSSSSLTTTSSSSSSSSSLNTVIPFGLQKALDIFSSCAADHRFNDGQKKAYRDLAQLASQCIYKVNGHREPQPVVSRYQANKDLEHSRKCAIGWLYKGCDNVCRQLNVSADLDIKTIAAKVKALDDALTKKHQGPIFQHAQPMTALQMQAQESARCARPKKRKRSDGNQNSRITDFFSSGPNKK